MLPHLHNRIELHHSIVISLVIKTHGEGKLVIIHGGECVIETNQRIPDTHSPPFSELADWNHGLNPHGNKSSPPTVSQLPWK